MKLKKVIYSIFTTVACVALALCVSGCELLQVSTSSPSAAKQIVSISKTSSQNGVEVYVVYYSDGTTSTFSVNDDTQTNGGETDNETAGQTPVSIEKIEKTLSIGLVDTYTVYFTNGQTTTFEITNGKDGSDITALDLYETYKQIYGENLTYEEFLNKYLSLENNQNAPEYTPINECLLSTAKVYAEFEEVDDTTEGKKEDNVPAVFTGACVVYKIASDYTYFITNYHVVYNEESVDNKISEKINCFLYGSEGYPSKNQNDDGSISYDYGDYAISCQYVGGAAEYDLAIIKANTQDVLKINPNVKAITFAEEYYVGQKAIAIGNPNGEGISATQGIISVDNEYITLAVDGTSRNYRSLRIDTALYHGNSGGGLFNANGELIGIANAGNVTDQNINYAIPVQIVKAVADNIYYYHNDANDSTNGVYKITLGITVTSENSKYVYDSNKGYGKIESQAKITEVTLLSLAYGMGLKVDDIITEMIIDGNSYEIYRHFDIGDYILSLRVNSTISFNVLRNGESFTTDSYTVKNNNLAVVA